MANCRWRAVGLAALMLGAASAGAAPVTLREAARMGESTRVLITLKADGHYRPAPPPGTSQAEPGKPATKPMALRVETRFDFTERVMDVDAEGRPRRVARWVARAAAAINGEVKPTGSVLRPEVALLVAEPRAEGVVVFSPGGPLTRPELELVQGAGDPLALADLLPGKPVAVGDKWRVGDEAARALSVYDTLARNALDAVLEAVDAGSARVRLKGEIRGAVLGGEGTIACDGSFTFDRKAGRVDRLTLDRSESRKAGPVENELDVKSTLTITRRAAETPPALADAALSGVSLDSDPARARLLLTTPRGKYTLLHDRDWHIDYEDMRVTVLKRLERGVVVAQANLALGPNAGKGRHQDLEQFRDDIRRALGRRFGQFVGVGEVDGDPLGGFRYKVAVRGREGDLGVVWNYYLVAGPEGDQLLAIFTLAEDQAKAFADQDLQMIGSLKWAKP
ncbi:MAG: hypothetical protein JOZ63_16740 [Planctomycetaceae bacterium]|nr:hypothetical protein [Planctomycetaceae bacterium]MBV8610649.1 hypothetical protein [Singulisphaera sp.]